MIPGVVRGAGRSSKVAIYWCFMDASRRRARAASRRCVWISFQVAMEFVFLSLFLDLVSVTVTKTERRVEGKCHASKLSTARCITQRLIIYF
jgi:hypothetical protein